MAEKVGCKIYKTIWTKHKAGRYDKTTAVCSKGKNFTTSYGTGERSD